LLLITIKESTFCNFPIPLALVLDASKEEW
jgi:hypothetical protein